MMMNSLYLISSEREASLIAVVNFEDMIEDVIDSYCYDKYHEYNGEFWVQKCYYNNTYWVPDESCGLYLDWVYDGKHYHNGETLPDGRVVM